jgi:hypothetical protein
MLIAFGALILGCVLVVPMHGAENSLHTNYLTFSSTVALPGVALPAGTYIFERVVDTIPYVVVVRDTNRKKVVYMAMTRHVTRPAGLRRDRSVTFGESRNGAPPPITAWYPVGENAGHAFIY